MPPAISVVVSTLALTISMVTAWLTGGVGAQATPGQNTEYYAFVGPGVKNAGPFSGNVSGFVSTDFSSYGSQGFAAEGAFGRATGGVGVYMNFTSLTACMDKAH